MTQQREWILTDDDRALLAELGVEAPPTEDELPETDGMPMDTERQALQMDLLFETLRLHYAGQNVYVGKNQIIYYSLEQVRNSDFLGPDVYVVFDVPDRQRKSWVIWQEGKGPDVVIQILSPRTRARDRGEKRRIYQDLMRVPQYVWYDPESQELVGLLLSPEERLYQPLDRDREGRLPCPVLGLSLVLWEGSYQARGGTWLRWTTVDGSVLPTREEAEHARAEAERIRADMENLRADQERTRAEAERRARGGAELAAEAERRRVAELEALLARYRARFGDVNGGAAGGQ